MSRKLKYDLVYNDPDTGKKQTIKKGTILYDEQDQHMKELRKEKEAKRHQRRDLTNGYGGFVLMRKTPLKKSISPQTLGRLTYLAVYLSYKNDDNKLMLTERQPMYRQDLPQVLGLPERTVDRFVDEAKNAGILVVDKYGQLFMDGKTFFRGKAKNQKKMRLYRKPIQQLYQKMSRSYDHYFGYVIALVPYINKEWNYVCRTRDNAEEKDLHKLDCMSIQDICELLDFDPTHSNRLVKKLKSIKFVWDEQEQALCNFIKEIGSKEYNMIINPDILYMGSNSDQVKVLGKYFPVKQKN